MEVGKEKSSWVGVVMFNGSDITVETQKGHSFDLLLTSTQEIALVRKAILLGKGIGRAINDLKDVRDKQGNLLDTSTNLW
jgi:hypothetical protein